MKRVLCFVLSVMLSVSLVVSVSAASFTASVESKSAPAVVEIADEVGNTAIAVLTGDLPEGMELVTSDYLVVTAVADAESSDQIPDASQQALLEVYTGLQEGTIQVPFEQLDEEKASNLVVRDLFDVSFTDVEGNDFSNLLDEEGVSLEITFAMEVAADETVYVMVYKNDAWHEIQQVTNNGDGTITCVFDHLCPVAVIVEANETMEVVDLTEKSAEDLKPEVSSDRNMVMWIGIMAASVVALAVVLVSKKRKQK